MISSVLITGPVGVGKTAVAIAAGDILYERGAAAAVVDLDWLGWLVGTDMPITEVIARNLEAIWPNLKSAGADYLVLTRAVENDADVELIRNAVPEMGMRVARLTADLETIHERLKRRDWGATLEEHLLQAAEMNQASFDERRAFAHVDIVISNEDHTAEGSAAQLLDALGWPL